MKESRPAKQAGMNNALTWVNATLFTCGQDALTSDDISRGAAPGCTLSLRLVPNVDHSVGHDLVHTLVDLALAPEVAGHVLYPLEVTHGYAAGVTDNVRYNGNVA